MVIIFGAGHRAEREGGGVWMYRPSSLLSIICTLNAPVSHACLVGEVRVGVVDHDCCNKREVFVERFLVDARVWGFDGGDNSCWVVAVRESLAFTVETACGDLGLS